MIGWGWPGGPWRGRRAGYLRLEARPVTGTHQLFGRPLVSKLSLLVLFLLFPLLVRLIHFWQGVGALHPHTGCRHRQLHLFRLKEWNILELQCLIKEKRSSRVKIFSKLITKPVNEELLVLRITSNPPLSSLYLNEDAYCTFPDSRPFQNNSSHCLQVY